MEQPNNDRAQTEPAKDQAKKEPSKLSRGISLRKLNIVMAAFSMLVALLFFLLARSLANNYRSLRTVTDNYVQLQQSAYALQDASDYLTEQVRSFVMTGDRAYLDKYFQEAKVTKRRDHALDTLRAHSGSAEAYRRLEYAMVESVSLMETEYRAMRLTVEANGYNLEDFPEEVRNAPLPALYDRMTHANMVDSARSMVLNSYYFSKKAAISRNMESCLSVLIGEMEEQQIEAETSMHTMILYLKVLVAVLIAVNLLRILLTSRLVLTPLVTGILYIRAGRPLPVKGVYELRFLARTYNQMYEANREHTEQLAYEVEHDALTGVYNRSGYEKLLERLDLSTCALLIIDVDKFKQINDVYGHDAGDRALQRVAHELTANFRHGDFICRIGGDEFTVLMPRTSPASCGRIEQNINRINDELSDPGDGLPPLSLSVGCAFGSLVLEGETLDKNADLALYRVKNNGRHGLAFYGADEDD